MRSPDLPVAHPPLEIELVVVVPTFNERENVGPLLERLNTALTDIRWEAIFVDDDSPDGTADLLREIAQSSGNVRVIQRIGRRGLSSACVEGVLSSSAPFFAVIDADMQHDEKLLPAMLKRLKDEKLDIVIGSRYVEGGSVRNWNEARQLVSRAAGAASRLVVRAELKDPMSGFFLMRRQTFDESVRNLSLHGFKILLDLFASAPKPLRFVELPYHFGPRLFGESKLDSMVAWEYGMLLADKTFGWLIPPRLVFFGVIGGCGLLVHMLVLASALSAGLSFSVAQTLAVVVAMTFNFILNNWITYRDQRLFGWRWLRGLVSFYAICSVGAVANIGIASFIFSSDHDWWVAGLSGALVGAVWNYALSSLFTWNRRSA